MIVLEEMTHYIEQYVPAEGWGAMSGAQLPFEYAIGCIRKMQKQWPDSMFRLIRRDVTHSVENPALWEEEGNEDIG